MRSRTTAVLVALAMYAVAAGAQPSTFRVAPEYTNVAFAVSQLGIATQNGRFERTQGTIVLDAEGKAGGIDFVVDAASVSTGWSLRDSFLRSEAMFDVERYPDIRFHSTGFGFDGERIVAVEGELTLHGVTRPVRLDVNRLECGTGAVDGRATCNAAVTGHISRRAFDMPFAYPFVGDEVALEFAVRAFRVLDMSATGAR
jgi:polyisoprenoid-binding protein YceI